MKENPPVNEYNIPPRRPCYCNMGPVGERLRTRTPYSTADAAAD